MSEHRSIDLSVEVPGTPEQVWEAIATGPGIGSWFTPAEVAGGLGGQVTLDFGEYGTHTATVTAWEPPRRFVYESGGDRPLAYEWLVEARSGGTCVVRLVNRGFGMGEDWDGDYDGMSEGWRIFLESLRLHLTHFPGRHAQAFIPTAAIPGPNPAAWSTLCEALGVPTDLQPGDRLATGDATPALAGTVEKVIARPKATAYLLRLDDPGPGTAFVTAEGDGEQVAASVYVYLYDPADHEAGQAWTSWLTSRFAAVQSQPAE